MDSPFWNIALIIIMIAAACIQGFLRYRSINTAKTTLANSTEILKENKVLKSDLAKSLGNQEQMKEQLSSTEAKIDELVSMFGIKITPQMSLDKRLEKLQEKLQDIENQMKKNSPQISKKVILKNELVDVVEMGNEKKKYSEAGPFKKTSGYKNTIELDIEFVNDIRNFEIHLPTMPIESVIILERAVDKNVTVTYNQKEGDEGYYRYSYYSQIKKGKYFLHVYSDIKVDDIIKEVALYWQNRPI